MHGSYILISLAAVTAVTSTLFGICMLAKTVWSGSSRSAAKAAATKAVC